MTEVSSRNMESSERQGGAETGQSTASALRISLLLIGALTFAAFAPSLENDFVNWDDEQNLVHNEAYRGLGPAQLKWMFSTGFGGHYQPLTWLSFALDHQVWGADAFGMHLTNVVLHLATTIGFFFVTLRMLELGIGESRRFALVVGALLGTLFFAVHPLRVESVAWATERRDVLSGVWLMLTILFYLRAAVAVERSAYRRSLAVALLFYCLSLLSKASGMPLPVVLLLLDVYPLRRFRGSTGVAGFAAYRSVLVEKCLFLIPAVAIAVLALWAQTQAGALRSLAEHPLGLRIGQAFYGIMFYPWKTIWPVGLAPLYEQAPEAAALSVRNAISGIIVLGVTAGVLMLRKRRPALPIAWGVYIAMLLPVLGLAQSGPQVVADRYTYLACMPLAVLVGAGVALCWPRITTAGRTATVVISLAVLILCMCQTRDQTRIWKDSHTLWAKVIERGGSAGIAHANLAAVLNSEHEYELACAHGRKALETLPGNRTAHAALGRCSSELGDLAAAEKHYEFALRIATTVGKTDTTAMVALAAVKTRLGRHQVAEELYRKVIEAEPGVPEGHYILGGFLASRGRSAEARACFSEALRLDPTHSGARYRLAVLLLADGDDRRAKAELEEGLRHSPGDIAMSVKLSWILATSPVAELRDGTRAVRLARRAIESAGGSSIAAREALAAGLAEAGEYDEAARTLEALLSDETLDLSGLQRERLQEYLGLCREKRAIRD